MNREEILESLRVLAETPPLIGCDEYWRRINEVSEKEHKAFSEESKKLKMSNEYLNKCFTI